MEAWGHGDGGAGAICPPGTHDYDAWDDNECGIIEAARQSTQGSFRVWDTDEKLLAYLYNNNHSTPFEFAGMVIEVQAPIFVFREWHRHRTQSYNEMSARYAPLPDLNYVPTIERLMRNSGSNKQAGTIKDSEELTLENAEFERQELLEDYALCEMKYQRALKRGVPKELARIRLPLGRYSRMRASANLRNWLAFCTLRSDPNAQYEIQQYSKAVESLIEQQFPKTYRLFLSRK